MTESGRIWKAIKMLNARAANEIRVLIPPTPVCNYSASPDEEGKLIGVILPADGSLSKFCLAVGEYSVTRMVGFTLRVQSKGGATEKLHLTHKSVEVFDINLDVKAGDVLTLSVEPGTVKDVMTSFLYHTGPKDATEIKVTFDELGIGDEGIRKLIG